MWTRFVLQVYLECKELKTHEKFGEIELTFELCAGSVYVWLSVFEFM